MTIYRPIDIARKLNISTSTLRYYEKDKVVPLPERTPTGYRIYTDTHLDYFRTVRTLSLGFGYQLTKEVMLTLLDGKMLEALWLINDAQNHIRKEKKLTDTTLDMLMNVEVHNEFSLPKRGWFTIGETSEELNIPTTALRHWCLEGLITVERDKESNYRMFTIETIQRVLFIRVIKASTWSLDEVRSLMPQLDVKNPEKIIALTQQSLTSINQAIQRQLIALHYFYSLCRNQHLLSLDDFPKIEW